jgi:dipeptidyl aminopeptidase/acylaminoacyl peptidase
MIMRTAFLCGLLLGLGSLTPLPAKEPFTFDALAKIARIDDPQVSPDGKMVAFTVQTVDLAANTKPTNVFVVSIDGGAPIRLTNDGTSNTRPRWTPDSKRIFYVSDRPNTSGGSDNTQVWSMNADGRDHRPITNIPTGADGVTISPDINLIIFTSDVYPDCEPSNAVPGIDYDAACNKANLDKDAASKMHARVYTSLLYRHWTQYQGNRRRHLLIQTLNAGKVRDLTPGPVDTPPFSLGGPEQYAFSPDSTQIAYVANYDPDLSTSTNSDIYLVSAAGGAPKQLTSGKGGDEGPLFSPDGKFLAFRTQTRPGYESDLWRLAVMDLQTNAVARLTDSLDRWVESYTWSADSKRLFFTMDDHGSQPLMMVAVGGGGIRTIAQGPTSISSMQFTPGDKELIYAEQSGSRPVEIFKATSKGGSGTALTHLNDEIFSTYQLTTLERITADGPEASKVESFVVKPPDFNVTKKYPVLFLIHGGPQGDWGESWSYRWNAQVFAGAGYVVVMPNPQGSIGYGQGFTDAVNGDWGGRAYQSIVATVNAVSALPYVDSNRMAAAGGSYGGYMIDWMLGHTSSFRALVSHAGVYDLTSEAGSTEELWFPKWEFQGFPWENLAMYEKWSPSTFVKNFKTPTLVTHGELDYRVPIAQGQQLFTALQQMKVPSKLVQFPDEGHWILKPQNSQFWYRTVIDFLDQYTKP